MNQSMTRTCEVILRVYQGVSNAADVRSDVVAVRTGATQLVLEELLMTDVQMHPFELLSWEGVFGTIFMVFALLTFNAIPGVPRREPGSIA